MLLSKRLIWQARRASNPQPSVLETDTLPIELLAYINSFEFRVTNAEFCTFNTRNAEPVFSYKKSLFDYFRNHTGTDGTTTFANREAQTFFHRNG